MKFYLDDNNLKIVQSVASASTLISSMSGQIRDYIIGKFPKDFFKSVYIDTSETFTQQRKNDKYNKDLNKIPYPSLAITPEISLDDAIGGMEKSLMLSSPNLFVRRNMNRTYKKLLIDVDDNFGIYYTHDYITTIYNFKITTNSFIQNADILFFIKSAFQEGMFQYLNHQTIQTEIPKTFIKMIAKMKNWDLNNDADMNALRLYLVGTGKQEEMILKKKNLSTGKTCFFIDEHQNFLTLLSDINAPSSIIRDNQVEGEYTIEFRVQVSAWLPNSFIFSINDDVYKRLGVKADPTVDEQDPDYLTVSIPLQNYAKLLKKETINFIDVNGQEHIGQLIFENTYTQKLGNIVKNIDILSLLPDDVQKAYEYLTNPDNNLGIHPTSLVKVVIVDKNGYVEDKNVSIFYLKDTSSVGSLGTLGAEFSDTYDSDFVIAVYLNRVVYETVQKIIEGRKNTLGTNYLTTIQLGNHDGGTQNVIVRSFENEIEENSTELEKQFRIKTGYGIGYIELSNPNLEASSEYRICGVDGNIYSLETSQLTIVSFKVPETAKDIANTENYILASKKQVKMGDTYGIFPTAPVFKNYKFLGWYLADGTKVKGTSEVMFSEPHDIFAIYKAETTTKSSKTTKSKISL